MNYELKDKATFIQTFGGEFEDDDSIVYNDYGFQIGDLMVSNLAGEEFAKFICSAADHLMLNGHNFKFTKTSDMDLPLRLELGRAEDDSSPTDVRCPNCNAMFNGIEWLTESLDTPLNIMCYECESEFSILAKPINIVWDVNLITLPTTKKEEDGT